MNFTKDEWIKLEQEEFLSGFNGLSSSQEEDLLADWLPFAEQRYDEMVEHEKRQNFLKTAEERVDTTEQLLSDVVLLLAELIGK